MDNAKVLEMMNYVNEVADNLEEYGEFTIPMLCMIIEEISKKNNMKVLDFYNIILDATKGVVEKCGEVI